VGSKDGSNRSHAKRKLYFTIQEKLEG